MINVLISFWVENKSFPPIFVTTKNQQRKTTGCAKKFQPRFQSSVRLTFPLVFECLISVHPLQDQGVTGFDPLDPLRLQFDY